MQSSGKLCLLDETGNPLNDRLGRVLCDLVPRFQRQFPSFKDEVSILEVLEEAARRIEDHERRTGPIERLHGYAWVTVRSVATSRMRRPGHRVVRETLGPAQSEVALSTAQSPLGSPEQIEGDILLHELLAQLTPDERLVCVWKKAGFSSKDIAKHRGSSVSAIDTLFFRARQKIRRILGVQESGASGHRPKAQERGTLVTFPSGGDGVDIERADG